jgi:aminobenzoyl-glutamate utilization protein B
LDQLHIPEELAFADNQKKEMVWKQRHKWSHKTMEVKILSGGSTDVGDVSYIVPEITLMATTAPYELRHPWAVVASGG